MNLHIFKHNEIVQVLDETTYIWEAAKIMGLESDWSINVKWVDWSSKPAIVIVVPEILRSKGVEFWNVRKFQKTERTLATYDKRSTRHGTAVQLPGNYRQYSGNPAKLTRHEEVSFMQFPCVEFSLKFNGNCVKF